MLNIKEFEYDYGDNNMMVCPFCGCENAHITGVFQDDPRVPDSKYGNVAIELTCEPCENHKWLIAVIEHKGCVWIAKGCV